MRATGLIDDNPVAIIVAALFLGLLEDVLGAGLSSRVWRSAGSTWLRRCKFPWQGVSRPVPRGASPSGANVSAGRGLERRILQKRSASLFWKTHDSIQPKQ